MSVASARVVSVAPDASRTAATLVAVLGVLLCSIWQSYYSDQNSATPFCADLVLNDSVWDINCSVVTPADKYSPANKAMADVLEGARGKARLSVANLADVSGVPYGTLVKVLNNRTAIDVGHITALAPALNRTPQSLVDEATEDMGGMDALVKAADERAKRASSAPLSEVRSTNVTPLHRKRNDQLTAEDIDAGNQDKAADEITAESNEPEDS